MSDWFLWHRFYADPNSELSLKLAGVHRFVRRVLDDAPEGSFVIVDICGGQGQALIPVLASHPRVDDVTAAIVELYADNVAAARAEAARAGLTGVVVVEADAGLADSYAALDRADFVILSGVVRHMTKRDARRFVRALPQICDADARVLWTRREDATARRIRAWFEAAGFREIDADHGPGIRSFNLARMECAPEALRPGVRWFTFRPYGRRWPQVYRLRERAARGLARITPRRRSHP
jgi:SAM-dependent methyltransferase